VIARFAVLGLVLVTALLIDTVAFAGLGTAGVGPSIVVLTVVAVGLTDGSEAGARFGFGAGLAVDLLSDGLVGLSALVLLLIGYLVGLTRPFLTGSVLLSQVIVGSAGSALAIALYGGLSLLFDPQGLTFGGVVVGAIVAGLVNGVLAPLVVLPVAAALRRVDVTLPT
jgi:rod shape-determining protein MreD